MKLLCFVFLLAAATVPVKAQFVDSKVLAAIDSISVSVGFTADDDANSCTPLESTIKTRIELRLRQAGIRVVDLSRARMYFETVAIHTGSGICAVSYSTQVLYLFWEPSIDDGVNILALDYGGIMTDGQYSSSRERMRQRADEAADLVINEILEAKQ